jgi:hypothetical protein
MAIRPVFDQISLEVKAGLRKSELIVAARRDVMVGDVFVLDGPTLYIAEVREPLKTTGGEVDRRLSVIFSNGTESNLLLRLLRRASYDDPAARCLTSPERTQLHLSDTLAEEDTSSGVIYVSRSLSPIHTLQSTVIPFIKLMPPEGLLKSVSRMQRTTPPTSPLRLKSSQAISSRDSIERGLNESSSNCLPPARLDITITDRFSRFVRTREWFVVPLFVIEEAVPHIVDGTITEYVYDAKRVEPVRLQAG